MSAVEPTRIGDQPCGVWSWQPPPGLVESLSDLFDRGLAATPRRGSGPVRCRGVGARQCGTSPGVQPCRRPLHLDVHVAPRPWPPAPAGQPTRRCASARALPGAAPGPCLRRPDLHRRHRQHRHGDAGGSWSPPLARPGGLARPPTASPLVGDYLPLHLAGSNLYLDRLWTDEVLVAADFSALRRHAVGRRRRGSTRRRRGGVLPGRGPVGNPSASPALPWCVRGSRSSWVAPARGRRRRWPEPWPSSSGRRQPQGTVRR